MKRSNFIFGFVLFAVVGLAYGLQVHRLGFYWDDWAFLYRYKTLGILNTIFYGPTRQLAVLLQAPGFLFADDSPLRWHLYMLVLRWAVALIFAWVLHLLWPARRVATFLMALLFAVHPAFTQNSIAVVYSIQILGYGVFLLSLGFTICALRSTRWHWLFSILALTTQALHLFSGEYYFGLELVRPLVIWLALGQTQNRLLKSGKYSLFYLGLLATYLLWRFGFFTTGVFETYDYKNLPDAYARDGNVAIIHLVQYALQDVVALMLGVWQNATSPEIIDFSQPYNLFSLAVVFFVTIGLYFILGRLALTLTAAPAEKDHFFRDSFLLGASAILVGFIPGWYVLRFIAMPGNFGDRFALPGLFGASILMIAALEFISHSAKNRNILMASLLIGLSVGLQMRVSNDYRWDWERQKRVYWQVYWRAPAVQAGTVFVGRNSISTTTVNYVGGYALNFVYGTEQSSGSQPPVWFVNYYKTLIPAHLQDFQQGIFEPKDQHGDTEVALTRDNLLVMTYESEGCLQVLSPGIMVDSTNIDDDYQVAGSFSNVGLVLPIPNAEPPRHIFGDEPSETWCYFYQKADLARQLGDWSQVLKLERQARQMGLTPQTDFEWIPFIEAYAYTGDWQGALDLSLSAYQNTRRTRTVLCPLWASFEDPAPEARHILYNQLDCAP